jgi:hypothetical protein
MGQDWIIDVLSDLRSFARKNDLPLLSAQLEETALVATAEIASTAETSSRMTRGDGAKSRPIFTSVGSNRRI